MGHVPVRCDTAAAALSILATNSAVATAAATSSACTAIAANPATAVAAAAAAAAAAALHRARGCRRWSPGEAMGGIARELFFGSDFQRLVPLTA